jgi:alkanesulfonate monooxygenase SsuD/methylene tetrahydromethanopterin reductase-like flavin-dependent oxidoreductase (luciferase family)
MMLELALSCAVVGGPSTVRQGLLDFIARTGADELMVTAQIHDHEARKRSYGILAGVRGALAKAA